MPAGKFDEVQSLHQEILVGNKGKNRDGCKYVPYRWKKEAPSRAEEEAPISENQNLLQDSEVLSRGGKKVALLWGREVMLRLRSHPQVG
jgi:hypothetical protein